MHFYYKKYNKKRISKYNYMSIIKNTNYYEKYIKYKSKYNQFKSQEGGGHVIGLIFFQNHNIEIS